MSFQHQIAFLLNLIGFFFYLVKNLTNWIIEDQVISKQLFEKIKQTKKLEVKLNLSTVWTNINSVIHLFIHLSAANEDTWEVALWQDTRVCLSIYS